jgi:hypothetical protein
VRFRISNTLLNGFVLGSDCVRYIDRLVAIAVIKSAGIELKKKLSRAQ